MDKKSPKPIAEHMVLVDGTKIHEFLDVEWYDTATPYQGCVRELQRLFVLAASKPFEIVSQETSHKISNQADFRQWVKEIFEHNGDFGFTKRLG